MSRITCHFSQVAEGMTLMDQEEIERAIFVLKEVRKKSGVMYLFGNGGSSATASHFANDLMKIARVRAVCLADATPVVTAYGNDDGWDKMFLEPLSKLFDGEKDGVAGISCGGSSLNVLSALEWTAGRTQLTIGMTGQSESSPINKIDLTALVHARVPDIRVQEDLHSIVCHAIVRELQELE